MILSLLPWHSLSWSLNFARVYLCSLISKRIWICYQIHKFRTPTVHQLARFTKSDKDEGKIKIKIRHSFRKMANESSNIGINKLKPSDCRTNARPETKADGGIGKQKNLDKTSTNGSQVSQDESRGIRKRLYVMGDPIVSGLNEKVLS